VASSTPKRDVKSINPAWEKDEQTTSALPGTSAAGALARSVAAATRRIAPALFHWISGKAPELSLRWGSREYALRYDGIHEKRREGKAWRDNPKSNYNEAVRRRQERKS
tara:strand:+ start:480 stop:806 length:327 start_codon:yes stop_codon:yes gene_type:complete